MTTTEINKQPIRPSIRIMRVGDVVTFPAYRYESVLSTVTRLNRISQTRRWSVELSPADAEGERTVSVKCNEK